MTNKTFESRRNVILVIVLSIGIIFTMRLLFVQVLNSKWHEESLKVSETKRIIEPERGLIFDRKGKLLAANKTIFELKLTPSNIKDFDTIALCQMISISKDSLIKKLIELKRYRRLKQTLVKTVPEKNIAKLTSLMFKFKGFELVEKSIRNYPESTAGHLLGYVREVDGDIVKKKPYYRGGDRIGISGLEKFYEDELRGRRGKNQFLKDAYGNLKELTASDTAKSGNNLWSTIDAELQKYGEKLMKNKLGSVIAIEPSTGEILAMVSSPNFDPNLLTGDTMSRNWNRLYRNDSLKPLFNRGFSSRNSPGSVFKMIQGLAAWELGVINENTKINCDKNLVGCHNHSIVNGLADAIKVSCNPYFYETFKRMSTSQEGKNTFEQSRKGLQVWNEYVTSFGLGTNLQLDFPNYTIGNIPSPATYDNIYKNTMKWNYRTCNSLAIGQGEMLVTLYQIANLSCIIANRGFYYYPHLIKQIEEGKIDSKYSKKNYTKISSDKFNLIVNAMQQVVEGEGGTASGARIEGIEICGKTGTVENSRGKDHSVFIAFAPKENPKIAIAVYIENAGYGGTWAAPIASLMTEKYLTDTIQNSWKEDRIVNANLIPKKR
jgi:penicillin-binding protein 2